MSAGLTFDREYSQRMETLYNTRDVVARRRAVIEALQLQAGERVVDIGCGPGFVAADMAAVVGSAGRIVGIDASEAMVAMARARCGDQLMIEIRQGDATQLPVGDGEFDVAVSVQVYEYVPTVDAALAEMVRVLRPGGRAAVVATDWHAIAWYAEDQVRMERMLAAWDEHLVDPVLPRTLTPRMRTAGFDIGRWDIIRQFNPQYDEDSYSHLLIDWIVRFVPGRQGITPEEAAAWAQELRALGAAGKYFFSLSQYLFLATKPA